MVNDYVLLNDITKELPSQFDLSIADENKRIFSGYASVAILDKQGDIVPTDEIERSMYKLMDRGGLILFGHQNKPVCKVLKWSIEPHPVTKAMALKLVCKVFDDYEIDGLVWQGIKEHKFKGFSIGATARAEKMLKKSIPALANRTDLPDEISVLKDLSLLEVSIVENPANQLALIDSINYLAKSDDKVESRAESSEKGAHARIAQVEGYTRGIGHPTKMESELKKMRKVVKAYQKDVMIFEEDSPFLKEVKEITKKAKLGTGGRFRALTAKLERQGKSPSSARKIAASIGRRKYGAHQMAKWAHHKKGENDFLAEITEILKCKEGCMLKHKHSFKKMDSLGGSSAENGTQHEFNSLPAIASKKKGQIAKGYRPGSMLSTARLSPSAVRNRSRYNMKRRLRRHTTTYKKGFGLYIHSVAKAVMPMLGSTSRSSIGTPSISLPDSMEWDERRPAGADESKSAYERQGKDRKKTDEMPISVCPLCHTLSDNLPLHLESEHSMKKGEIHDIFMAMILKDDEGLMQCPYSCGWKHTKDKSDAKNELMLHLARHHTADASTLDRDLHDELTNTDKGLRSAIRTGKRIGHRLVGEPSKRVGVTTRVGNRYLHTSYRQPATGFRRIHEDWHRGEKLGKHIRRDLLIDYANRHRKRSHAHTHSRKGFVGEIWDIISKAGEVVGQGGLPEAGSDAAGRNLLNPDGFSGMQANSAFRGSKKNEKKKDSGVYDEDPLGMDRDSGGGGHGGGGGEGGGAGNPLGEGAGGLGEEAEGAVGDVAEETPDLIAEAPEALAALAASVDSPTAGLVPLSVNTNSFDGVSIRSSDLEPKKKKEHVIGKTWEDAVFEAVIKSSTLIDVMKPGPGHRFSPKEDRMAHHIAASERKRGVSSKRALSIGYATVNSRKK